MPLPALLERDISGQVTGFMKLRSWRHFRHNVSKIKDSYGHWTSFNEAGMPDDRYVWELPWTDPRYTGLGLTLWVEFKQADSRITCPRTCRNYRAPAVLSPREIVLRMRNKSAKICRNCVQAEWRLEAQRRGSTVVIVGKRLPDWEDSMADFKAFEGWYNARFAWLHGANAPRKGVQTELVFPRAP